MSSPSPPPVAAVPGGSPAHAQDERVECGTSDILQAPDFQVGGSQARRPESQGQCDPRVSHGGGARGWGPSVTHDGSAFAHVVVADVGTTAGERAAGSRGVGVARGAPVAASEAAVGSVGGTRLPDGPAAPEPSAAARVDIPAPSDCTTAMQVPVVRAWSARLLSVWRSHAACAVDWR